MYRSTSSGSQGALVKSVSGSTFGYTDTGLTNGTIYYYEITAINSVGEGPPRPASYQRPRRRCRPGRGARRLLVEMVRYR